MLLVTGKLSQSSWGAARRSETPRHNGKFTSNLDCREILEQGAKEGKCPELSFQFSADAREGTARDYSWFNLRHTPLETSGHIT